MKIQDIGNRGEDIGGWRRYESENENESDADMLLPHNKKSPE